MAVAEFPVQSIAVPRRTSRVAKQPAAPLNLAWVPLAAVLIGIASLFYLAQAGEVTSTGYNIQQTQSDIAEWEMKNEQMSLAISQAKALPRIETEATKRLLMVPTKDPFYFKFAAADSVRGTTTNRGDSRVAPALEKPGASVEDPMDTVRNSISLLVPRLQSPQR